MSASVPAKRTQLPNTQHHLPPGSVMLRQTNPNQRIELTLGVRRKKNLPDLSALDLVGPTKRRYLSRDDLKATYGADANALERIRAFAQAHNLTVLREELASARLTLAGTVADATAAFGVTLNDYHHPTLGDFHARVGLLSVPESLQDGDITGVFGFNNHRALRRRPRAAAAKTADAKQKTRPWFLPTELVDIYNFPQADLSNQTIGLLEFGGGVEQSDLTNYFQQIGVPAPTVQIIAQPGVSTDPQADPDSTGEVMLDIEVAGAMAPGAKIAVYFSTFDEKGLVDVLSTVIEDQTNNPGVVSISWGWGENQPFSSGILWSPSAMDHVNHSFLAAAQIGITICVSTGDDGSEAQVSDGLAHVNFPATSPYVLAVGGTTLHVHHSAGGTTNVQELVWNDGSGSGTGGGVSDLTPMPTWQEGVVKPSINPGNFAGRAIPDVAANADPSTGYYVMSGGKPGIVGGTSASAPLWASLITRINAAMGARAGNFNALLYMNYGPNGVLRDITIGNNDTEGLLNGQFAAEAGWDACTGWGVPDGARLLAAMQS